jgi:hypothetical protein
MFFPLPRKKLNFNHRSAANGIVLEEIERSGDSAKVHTQRFPFDVS